MVKPVVKVRAFRMFMKWRVAVNENRQLGILLLEDIPFDKLLIKLERAFGVSLPCEDDKGAMWQKQN